MNAFWSYATLAVAHNFYLCCVSVTLNSLEITLYWGKINIPTEQVGLVLH